MDKIKVLSLFSGIGAFEKGLDKTGVDYEVVNYCEIDKVASKAYSIIHDIPESKNMWDVTKIDTKDLEDFDLLTYGFPCQDLSALGNMDGLFNEDGLLTRSGLFFEAMRIASDKKPKYMIAENVKALTFKKNKDMFDSMVELLDQLGYNSYYKVLNSKDFGIPHSRQRVFIISILKEVDDGFEFPSPTPLAKKATDYFNMNGVSDEYYTSEQHEKYYNEFRLKKKYSSINAEVIVCQTTKQGQKSNPQNFVRDSKGMRIMTSEETFKLQGFDAEDAIKCKDAGISTSKIGFMAGNSITVPVLEAIFNEMFGKNKEEV